MTPSRREAPDRNLALELVRVTEAGAMAAGRWRAADGGYRWLLWAINPVPEEKLLYAVAHDITDRRETESRMAHMAYHDTLTELPNRAAFLQALEQMIDACEMPSDASSVADFTNSGNLSLRGST